MLPAYAGMILVIGQHCLPEMSAPRIRGDDPGVLSMLSQMGTCSPHTRG